MKTGCSKLAQPFVDGLKSIVHEICQSLANKRKTREDDNELSERLIGLGIFRSSALGRPLSIKLDWRLEPNAGCMTDDGLQMCSWSGCL
jgi:hypothetical protein